MAFTSYEPGSELTYSELLVARPVRGDGRWPGPRASVTDIWVDSPASAAGGRALWAIPKLLCDFDLETVRRGPLSTTDWSATLARRPVAEASFADVSRAMVRLPFRAATWQPGLEETGGAPRSTGFTGSARALPCRGRWSFAADGPLAWLRAARPVAAFRLADFRMSFG